MLFPSERWMDRKVTPGGNIRYGPQAGAGLGTSVTLATTRSRKVVRGWGLRRKLSLYCLQQVQEDVCFVVAAGPRPLQPPGGAGGGPEARGAGGGEPAVRRAARAEPRAAGNHFQRPAGDHHPHGILCLQAHPASVTAQQASVSTSTRGQDKLCCAWASAEVGTRTWKRPLVWTVGKRDTI